MLTHHEKDTPTAQDDASSVAGFRVTHQAMATTWSLYGFGDASHDCEHAAELAFEQIDWLERQLSYFLPESDIGQLNRAAPNEPITGSIDTLECLRLAKQLHELTGGAFDPTVGALLEGREPWHLASSTPPEGQPPGEGAAAGDRPGLASIHVDEAARLVSRRSEAVELDLGAIGKGYAIDRALTLVADWLEGGVMLVAGESTMRAIGPPPGDGPAWAMVIRDPSDETTRLDEIGLTGEATAISAAAPGAAGHVLDPRTGRPADAARGAWAVAPSGAVSDALATAALVMSPAQIADCCQRLGDIAIARLTAAGELEAFGRWRQLRDTLRR